MSAGNAGQLVSMTGTLNGASRNQTFRYDDLGRLEKATGSDLSGAWQRRFVYDRLGNRTQVWNATVGGTQTQQVNFALIGSAPSNRVASYWDTATTGGATKTVSYDAAGNTTNDGTYTFTYDGENRIVQVNAVATGALVASYTYDSANRRIKKTVGATTTCSVWEGAQVIAEYNNAAAPFSPNTEYIFTGARMLAEERTGSGTTRFFHQDRLSIRLTTNSSGAVLGTQSHLPFGEALSESSEQQKWKFTTYERDSETGDDYAINRGYWPTLGRFRQADPVLGRGPNPQLLNRFAYVKNDPVNLIDPFGLNCIPLPDGTFDCTSDPPIVRLEGTGHNSSFSGFGSSPCTEIYIDGFYAGSTCGGLQPFLDGGGGPQNPAPKGTVNTNVTFSPCGKGSPLITINGNAVQTGSGEASIKLDGPAALFFGLVASGNQGPQIILKPNTVLSASLLGNGGYQISSNPAVSIDFAGPNVNVSRVQFNSIGSVSKVKADYLGFGRPISGIVKSELNAALNSAFGPGKGIGVNAVQSLLDTLNKNETGFCANATITVSKP